MNEQVPTFAVVATSVSMIAAAIAVAVVMRRAAAGRLGINHLAGLRTAATMRDQAAWQAAHRAGLAPTDVGMAGMGLCGALLLLVPNGQAFLVLVMVGTVWGVGWVLVGGARGVAAAKAEPEGDRAGATGS